MTLIVHRTPGLIDLKSFTLMGATAKPNSTNPIGQFGTGLKYAIAVLVRMGANVVVYIGRDRHEFTKRADKFRGTDVDLIIMKRLRWSMLRPTSHEMPYATTYGLNWKAWMAFRELESNTRDEGGETYGSLGDPVIEDSHTYIIVDLPEYTKAWEDRDNIFLPASMEVLASDSVLEIRAVQDNTHLYYRGLRAKDLPKKTAYTYNFLVALELSEDRQLAQEFMAKYYLALFLLVCDDEAIIERVVTGDESYWEYNMDFPTHVRPSAAFSAVALRHPKHTWPSVSNYWAATNPEPPAPRVRVRDQFDLHPAPWTLNDEETEVADADGCVILVKPAEYAGDWGSLVTVIRKLCFRQPLLGLEDATEDELGYADTKLAADPDFGEEPPGRVASVADSLLTLIDAPGEQFPARMSDKLDPEPEKSDLLKVVEETAGTYSGGMPLWAMDIAAEREAKRLDDLDARERADTEAHAREFPDEQPTPDDDLEIPF